MSVEHWSVSAPWVFKDVEYSVSVDVRDDVLVVQVEDKLTADQWSGQFDVKHIEELTRKTGNFKQFPVFINMLESAVTKSSDSVTLDLLTYSDLEALRKKRVGTVNGRSSSAQSKRYLIMTYSVEFDRIHYPLALPYSGKPDPAILQQTILQLQSELERYKKQTFRKHNDSAIIDLQRQYEDLLQEKEELEEAFETFKQDILLTNERSTSGKEIRILKKVVKNLEEELLKERSKHQRYTSKKNEEMRLLLQELEELRISERTLQSRVKSLTNELAILKRGLRSPSLSSHRNSLSSSKKTSTLRARQGSSSERKRLGGGARLSLSAERKTSGYRSRTPSPMGVGRVPRFDPTAYVESKKKKQHDAEIRIKLGKMNLHPPRSRSNSIERLSHSPKLRSSAGRPRYRMPSSQGSSRGSSRRSSVSNLSDDDRGLRGSGTLKGRGSSERSQRSNSKSRKRGEKWSQRLSSTPRREGTHNNSGLLDNSSEISKIDARLNALQEFMKRSLDSAKR